MRDVAKVPPSLCLDYRFAVGHDRHGRWVVCDRQGVVGGVFRDRASAIKFAMEESGREPGQVFCVPDMQVLNPKTVFASPLDTFRRAIRRAA